MLHRRRKQQAELAAKEAAGESFWTDKFDDPARVKIVHAFRDTTHDMHYFFDFTRGIILRDEGKFFLVDEALDASTDLLNAVLTWPDEMIPTILEAMSRACNDKSLMARSQNWDAGEYFAARVNIILREHRISYELVGSQMVEFSSRALHQQVVVPALQLLAGRKDLITVESAYGEALKELSDGNAANAITDAGTALQELLVALGCSGNALGPLITSAKAKKILAGHDLPLANAIEKTFHWVSADRSEKGDAHAVSSARIEDAWLIVQVVGALILRFSSPELRGNA